ncbi:von Willebrand factor A [Candidatus Liberibacter americanus PW_SP]|nr:von Willebrand factor A [Candidatus Liberibacter americanus PW_SP]
MYTFNKNISLDKISIFLKNKCGLFKIISVFIIMSIFFLTAFVIDLSRVYQIKSDIQESIDNSIVAGSSSMVINNELDKKKTEDILRKAAGFHISRVLPSNDAKKIAENANIDIKVHRINPAHYTIQIKSEYQLQGKDLILGSIITKNIPKISCISSGVIKQASKRKGVSIQMVLDFSGSMIGRMKQDVIDSNKQKKSFSLKRFLSISHKTTKVETLKVAANDFVETIKVSTMDKKLSARIGIIPYSGLVIRQNTVAISSSFDYIKSKIDKMTVDQFPGTDSSKAMAEAYDSLSDYNRELIAHNLIEKDRLKRYIIFMTDGVNEHFNNAITTKEIDDMTLHICNKAKEGQNGMEIYTISVDANKKAEEYLLKKCASSENHFYAVKNTEGLINCFKNIATKIQEKHVRIAPDINIERR